MIDGSSLVRKVSQFSELLAGSWLAASSPGSVAAQFWKKLPPPPTVGVVVVVVAVVAVVVGVVGVDAALAVPARRRREVHMWTPLHTPVPAPRQWS
jgi:hypothetical protein